MRLAFAIFCLFLPFAALAEEEDILPRFGALEDAKLAYSLTRAFDGYELPTGPFTRDEKPVRKLEGRVREWVYQIESEASTLEVIRNYEQRLAELGYEFLFECAQNECGGFDFRFGVYLVDPPAMRFDLADFRYLGAENIEDGVSASILASRQGGKLFVQVVEVEGEAAPISMTPVENAPRPSAKPGDARLFALARRLTESGHAPLEGIAFEAGSAKLTVESGAALEQAAQLLQGRPDLKFLVVGHTDNQGDLALNMALSRKRAESVAAALASIEGVNTEQIAPHGVGFLAPRAPNSDDEGRRLNRRVELVLE